MLRSIRTMSSKFIYALVASAQEFIHAGTGSRICGPGELEPLDDGVPMLPELLLDNDVTVVVGISLAEPLVRCRLKEVQGPPVCCHLRVQVCHGPPVHQLLEPMPV